MNAAKVIDAGHALDFESTITRLERKPIDELDETGDRFAAAQMRNVDTFDRTWCFLELEDLLESRESFFGIDMKHFGLGVCIQFAAPVQ